jgi:hypothetical protein
MRTLVAILFISTVPLASAWADDSNYHHVYFTDKSPSGTMDYWDNNQFANQMVSGVAPMNNGSGTHGFAGMSPAESMNYCSQSDSIACQQNLNLTTPRGYAPAPTNDTSSENR